MSGDARTYGGGVIFDITVTPDSNCRRIRISRKRGFEVSVTSPPVGGKANREVIEFLSSVFGRHVEIHGPKKREEKSILIPGMDLKAFEDAMNRLAAGTK